jgi:hypothetical protein
MRKSATKLANDQPQRAVTCQYFTMSKAISAVQT